MSYIMEGAVWHGSIRVAAIVGNPERQKGFMMRDIGSDILKEVVELRPAWCNLLYPATKHGRAGNS